MSSVENRNPALGTSFIMEVARMPEFNYFIQKTELPGISMTGFETPYMNHQGQLPSNRIDYESIPVTFILDEYWSNYIAFLEWFYSIRTNNRPITEEMSDVTVHLTNSNKNSGRKMVLRGAFPTQLTSVTLDSAVSDATVLLCTVTFKYQFFELLNP